MLKTCLLLLFSMVAFISHAQLTKSSWLVGGSASFESTKYTGDDDNTTTLVQVMPGAGYFFMDKLAVGLRSSVSGQ